MEAYVTHTYGLDIIHVTSLSVLSINTVTCQDKKYNLAVM